MRSPQRNELDAELLPARLEATPAQVRPNAPLTLTLRLRHPPEDWSTPTFSISLNGAPTEHRITLDRLQGSMEGALELAAPSQKGDHLFSVHGREGERRIATHALVHVSAGDACAPGEMREAGSCVPIAEGHHIRFEGGVNVNNRGPDRYAGGQMTHPRAAARIGDVIVACMTDAIGLIPADELPKIGEPETGAADRLRSHLVEVLLEKSGIVACENFLVLADRGIVITSSRGADRQTAGGLASWRLPPLDRRPLAPPRHISTLTSSGGFEGVARHGDWIYAVRKPNAIAALRLSDQGRLGLEHEVEVPGMRGGWAIAARANRLFVTDAQGGTDSKGAAGRLHVLALTPSGRPRLLGSAPTSGTPRDVELLGSGVVAVANGALGIDLFDVSEAGAPIPIARVETPGSTMELSFDAGYLLVADWDSIRLYDASEHGRLRLLDAADAFHPSVHITGGGLVRTGLFAANFVDLRDGHFLATEFNVLLSGRIQTGAGAARLIVHDRGVALQAGGAENRPIALRVSNGGRRQLDLSQRGQGLTRGGGPWSVPPGATAKLEIELERERAAARSRESVIVLHSNDPLKRRVRIPVTPPAGYRLGDLLPSFRLPMINLCPDGSCPERTGCFDLAEEIAKGRPILLAAFASW